MSGRVLALDIGGTSIKSALFDAGDCIVRCAEAPSSGRLGAGALMAAVCRTISGYADNYDAIGVSTTGQVDSKAGRIVFANDNVPNYTGFPIREFLHERFAVPVVVENDVNAAALGEAFFGAARSENSFLCLTLGTGVGGAIVMDRKIYSGADGVAGEFGHIVAHPGGRPCVCGQRGCYEQYASTGALVRAARALDERYQDGRAIFCDIDRRAELRKIVDLWIAEVAGGLATLTHIFNPRLFVLGGGVAEQPYVLDGLRRELAPRLMPSYRNVHLVGAALGNRAGVYGALHIARQALAQKGP